MAALLRDHPYDAAAARALAELRLARGVQDERTVELARRAVAFGGGAEAKALLERIAPHAEAGDSSASAEKADAGAAYTSDPAALEEEAGALPAQPTTLRGIAAASAQAMIEMRHDQAPPMPRRQRVERVQQRHRIRATRNGNQYPPSVR